MRFDDVRREYASAGFELDQLDPDPIEQFRRWYADAAASEPGEPNAMTLATAAPGGPPSARIVLLKGIDAGGFTFHTHYDSRKGRELAANPRAALVFHWPSRHRQVRIEGTAERTSPADSDAYFATRPPLARVSAAASPQSAPVADRAELERRIAEVLAAHPEGDVPRPEHWGGIRVVPDAIEFWQGQPNRLHDRARYERDGDGWRRTRLAP
jgi:pyridoxamine 5'-phosphate oxidase